jgi:hypothetical protein
MDSSYVYSRTADSWRLVFVHAGKLLHFLMRALLMTLASAGLALAWLCCWVDRYRSGKGAAWLIPVTSEPAYASGRPLMRADRLDLDPEPRTIDSLIRTKGRGL